MFYIFLCFVNSEVPFAENVSHRGQAISWLRGHNGFNSIGVKSAVLTNENGFIYSSIPYVLYGIFLIVYFSRYPVSVPLGSDEIPAGFISKYNITEREREIIIKVLQWKSNEDIARELFISLATVKTHLYNVYKKVGIDSRYDLLARVRSGQ